MMTDNSLMFYAAVIFSADKIFILSDKIPINLFIGSGSVLTRVGIARIPCCSASSGCNNRSITSNRYWPGRCCSHSSFRFCRASDDFGLLPAINNLKLKVMLMIIRKNGWSWILFASSWNQIIPTHLFRLVVYNQYTRFTMPQLNPQNRLN